MNTETRDLKDRQCTSPCGAEEPHDEVILAGGVLCGGCGQRRRAAKYRLVSADDETERLREENARLRKAASVMEAAAWAALVGVGRHNEMAPDCPGRMKDISGPVIDQLRSARFQLRELLINPPAKD